MHIILNRNETKNEIFLTRVEGLIQGTMNYMQIAVLNITTYESLWRIKYDNYLSTLFYVIMAHFWPIYMVVIQPNELCDSKDSLDSL